MSKARTAVFGSLLMLLFGLATTAAAEPFGPGDVLRMTFDLSWYPPPNFPVPLTAFDAFEFHPGLSPIDEPVTYTVRLFDRGHLLGTYSGNIGLAYDLGYPPVAAVFARPTSFFTRGNPTPIDFTTFNDGTIQGTVELTIDSGSFDVRRITDEFGLEQTYSFKDIGAQATFGASSLEIVSTPEPGSLVLVLSGIVGVVVRRRTRSGRLGSSAVR
jgi:hypothetical protein